MKTTAAPRGRVSDERGREIMLGLAICGALTKPGQCRTHAEIAAFAGCTKQAISLIEQRAFRKLRNALHDDPAKLEQIMDFRAPLVRPTGFRIDGQPSRYIEQLSPT